jgi:hypothetical protein
MNLSTFGFTQNARLSVKTGWEIMLVAWTVVPDADWQKFDGFTQDRQNVRKKT